MVSGVMVGNAKISLFAGDTGWVMAALSTSLRSGSGSAADKAATVGVD